MTPIALKILVIEDNIFDQQIIFQILKTSALYIEWVLIRSTAKQGIEELIQHKIDYCFFDIGLPEHDGIWFLEHYLNHPERAHTPLLIALSDNPSPTVAANVIQLGAHGFIEKNHLKSTTIAEHIRKSEHYFHQKQNLLRQANCDNLTELLNRHEFIKQFQRIIARLVKNKNEGIFLFFDIDNFKTINDKHGHIYGDQILKAFAESLSNCCRPQDLVGRLGGDEFVVFMPNTPLKEAEIIIHRLQKQLQQKILINNNHFKISTSIGASCFPKDGLTCNELMLYADKALYNAKHKGRAQMAIYSTD